MGAHEETFAEPVGDFIFQIVNLAALFGVSGCSLFLEIFGMAIEDLKGWSSRSLHCVCAEGCGPPADSWWWEERAEGGWLHVEALSA